MLPEACCRMPSEMDTNTNCVQQLPLSPTQEFTAELPEQEEAPRTPEFLDVLLRVQDQQLSSLDALRQLRAQHQEWQRNIQAVLKLAQPPKSRAKTESSITASPTWATDAEVLATVSGPEVDVADDVPASPPETVSVAPTAQGGSEAEAPQRPSHVSSAFLGLVSTKSTKSAGASIRKSIRRQMTMNWSVWPHHWQPWLEQLIERSNRPPTPHGTVWSSLRVWAYSVVTARSFEHLIGAFIFFNLILQGFETELELRGYSGTFFARVDILFNIIYSLEIVLRCIAGGLSVLCDTWFLVDATLVLLGIFASVFSVSGGGSARQMIVVRGLRLIRLGRAVRMTKKFKVMWHLVNGLLNSAMLMISVFALLTLSIYIFACLGVELISKDETLQQDEDTSAIIEYHFSNLPLTMMTLIQFITLDSIASIYYPIVREQPTLILYFLPILMILPITLMNLVTAVLVEHGLEHAQHETAEANRLRARFIKKSVLELSALFQELDRDGNGQITRAELKLVPPQKVPKELLDVLFVDELADVFVQLDVDGTGELSKDEFVDGILQMITRDTPLETLQMMKIMRSMKVKVESIVDRFDRLEAEEQFAL